VSSPLNVALSAELAFAACGAAFYAVRKVPELGYSLGPAL